ncbi:SCO family protein [Rubritalea sp.]|uniref:SCO family protein n=1 Tax=Rubritalea sp. TaxID=2109375 RepID=UPI003EF2015C
MKDKTKIILIYVSVGVLSVVLISLFMWIGAQRNAQAEQSEAKRNAIVIEDVVKPLTQLDKQLTEDLKGVNQDGEEVSLFDLKGKAVVFAQFYSRCNMCLGHNKTIMQQLHNDLKDNPNVHFVTVTLDPDFDSPEKLAEAAKVWGADSDSWWMLNVSKEQLTKYCREQLWYIDYADNEDKTGAADAITHDMGIAVIDPDSKLRAKVNLYELKSSGQDELYEAKKSQLLEVVDIASGKGE